MEVFWLLIVLGLVFGPLTLSIVALTQIAKARRQIDELNARVRALGPSTASAAPVAEPAVREVPAPALILPRAPPPIPVPKAEPPPAAIEEKPGLEVALGARVASYVGIAAVVISIVFFVGYAIQHNWIGPGMRVIMGLAAGAALIIAGYTLWKRDERLGTLSRALTGGGAALFFFSVYAAYGVYHLIGATLAGIGLVASALLVLGLSRRYDSQSVALLGVLGAFITPLLITDLGDDWFPMIYVAIVNVPVLLLGLRRQWRWLDHLAFLFTMFYAMEWISRAIPERWIGALVFAAIFYAQFAVMSYLLMSQERGSTGRTFDQLRLAAAASFFGLALYEILGDAGHENVRGFAFAAAGVIHGLVAQAARRRLGGLRDEALAFAVVAIGFLSFAVPVQFDGVWVSLGWAIEGALLATLALRVRSGALQFGAFALGMLAILRAMSFERAADAAPFLNPEFGAGLLSVLLMGIQAKLHERQPADGGTYRIHEILWGVAVLSLVAVAFGDTFETMAAVDVWKWSWTTAVLLGAGVLALALDPKSRLLAGLGFALLLAVPLKTICIDLPMSDPGQAPPFFNALLWLRLALPIGAVVWFARRGTPANAAVLYVSAIVSALVLVTVEIQRTNSAWADSATTLFWAASAMALTGAGLMRRRAWLRYAGLALFALTVVKVFVVDLEDLRGLQRIAAFLGVGVLLLVLSFVYQRIAPKIAEWGREDSG